MDLVVDCVHEIGPLDHLRRSTRFLPAGLWLTKDMQLHMAHAGLIPPGDITYARVRLSWASATTAPKAAEPVQTPAALDLAPRDAAPESPYLGRDPPSG